MGSNDSGRLVLAVAPTTEPVSVADVETHLRLDASGESSYVSTLISASRQMVERITGRALITQTWRLVYDAPPSRIVLPMPPLQSVESITFYDWDNDSTTQDSDSYIVQTNTEPGEIILKNGYSWDYHRDVASCEILYVAGYGNDSSDVPAALRLGVLTLTAKMYERRGEDPNLMLMESDVLGLLQPYIVMEA